MGPYGRDLVYRLALHQPMLHNAEHGLADHLCVAALWCAPTRERDLTPLVIPASELQQRGVHLALPPHCCRNQIRYRAMASVRV